MQPNAIERIRAEGLIVILRPERSEDLLPAAKSLREAGRPVVEIVATHPEILRGVGRIRAAMGNDLLIGVGAIPTAEAGREAIGAGAQFLVTPYIIADLIRLGRETDVAVISGAFTLGEIAMAWEHGAALVEMCPAGAVGPRYFQAVRRAADSSGRCRGHHAGGCRSVRSRRGAGGRGGRRPDGGRSRA